MVLSPTAHCQQKRLDPIADQLKALSDEYYRADGVYQAPLMATKTSEEFLRIHLDPAKDPRRAFIPRFEALAARADGTDVAAGSDLDCLQRSTDF